MVKLITQPILQAADASGNPLAAAGVVVTANITTGDGKVVDGATATTDANGIAAFQRLTLGATNGVAGAVTLSFDSPGLKPVTSQVTLACSLQTVGVDATVADSLSAGDCTRNAGFLFKQYTVNVALPTKALRLRNSAPFVSTLLVKGPNEPSLYLGGTNVTGPTSFKALVPPGNTRIISTSLNAGATGPFTLTVNAVAEDEVTCEYIVIQTPVATNQSVRADCNDSDGNHGDFFLFDLAPGGSISASVTSSAFTPFIAIWKYFTNATAPETSALATGSSAQLSFTNATTATAFYYVFVGSSDGAGTGAYSLNATLANPVSAQMRGDADSFIPLLIHSPTRSLGGPRPK
jgi:hypothetical protein